MLDSSSGGGHPPAMADDAELVIAGAGLSGMLLGVACAGAGLQVAIVDPQDPAAMLGEGFDGRTSAIAYGSRLVFDGIGLWPRIAAEAEPIREIRVADDDSPLFLHYDSADLGGETPLGYIVENRVLRRALLEHARILPNLRLLAPGRIAGVEATATGAVATLDAPTLPSPAPHPNPPPQAGEGRVGAIPGSSPGRGGSGRGNGARLRTRLVAAADGMNSPLRRAAGIRAIQWRYRQTGIVTAVAHARPHGGIAVEHFLPAGPFAILPMRGNFSSIVWTEDCDLAPRLLALPEAEFAAELRARFGDYLGPIEPVGPRWSYPLALMQAERYVGRRLALVGEAAHVIHPIAGQGLNIGIRDIAALAELIVDRRRLGLDIGDEFVLEQYQRHRRSDALLLAAVTDGLNRLFSNTVPPIRLGRDLGLAIVNRLPPVKRLLMQHAMGTLGDRPRLARGQPL